MKKTFILFITFLAIGITGCGEQNTKNNTKASQNPNLTPKEMLQTCGSVFFYLSDMEQNPYRRSAMTNAAYSFVNVARYGYDKPYFNKDAESDSKIGANKMTEQKYSLNEANNMAQVCISAGREYSIIIVGVN